MNNSLIAQETKWYNRPPFSFKAFIFFAFIVFFPVGIFLLWKSSKVKTGWKVVFTIIGAFFGLVVTVAIFAPKTPEMVAQEKREDSVAHITQLREDSTKAIEKKQNEISNAAEPASNNLSLEEKLATLDASVPVKKNDIKVVRIRALLDFLSKSYSEPKDTIAEYTSKAQDILEKEYGIKETHLHILEEMNTMGKIENTKYSSAITLYLVVRSRQSSETK
jgi:hypothetical protein